MLLKIHFLEFFLCLGIIIGIFIEALFYDNDFNLLHVYLVQQAGEKYEKC